MTAQGTAGGFRARLEVVGGPESGVVFDVRTVPVRIGRDRACDVVLRDDEQVLSSQHAELDVADGRPVILDRSRNGTALQRGLLGRRQDVAKGARVPLEDGDVIVLTSSIRLRFHLVSGPAAVAADPLADPARRAPEEVTAAIAAATAAEAKAASRRKLMMLGLLAFWGLVGWGLATVEESVPVDPADVRLVDAIATEPSHAGVTELAELVGDAEMSALRDRVYQAGVDDKLGRRQEAIRGWSQVSVWCRERMGGPSTALLRRVAEECDRRRARLERP